MMITGGQRVSISNRAVRTVIGCVLGILFQSSIEPLYAQVDSGPRSQIIGIFDSQSGQPLKDVTVLDVFTGKHSATTATGTARLNFVTFRGEAALIEIRKLGF